MAVSTVHRDIRRIVGLAYAVAAGRVEWREFLEAYRVTSSSAAATMMRWNRATGANDLLTMTGDVGNDAAQAYQAYYRHLNPHFNRYPELMTPGNVTFGHRRVPLPELVRTEYHADYLRKFDMEGVMGACLSDDQGDVTQLCVLRPFKTGLYDEDDERRTRLVLPHVQRAVHASRRLTLLRESRLAQDAAFEIIPDAVLVMEDRGRSLRANRAAAGLFTAGVLRLSASGLETWDPVLTMKLRRDLRQAAAAARQPSTPPPLPMILPSPSGTSSYRVTVVPGNLPVDGHRAAPVTVIVSRRRSPRAVEALAARYRLTPREAQVASLLLDGLTTPEIAEALHRSVETVRTHAKRVLRKSGERRVTSLVRTWARHEGD